ncbi:MAG: YraN family protein [Acidobacteria bacterium]|nr:YraN family protein [Acidobacteriota bacterium]
MPLLARFIFGLVHFAARNGIAAESSAAPDDSKLRARQTGIRGETYAYWYLRRHGYILIARNFRSPGVKGEIDLVGYDGPALAFVEVKTSTRDSKEFGKPEDAVTPDKRFALTRMAKRFITERRIPKAQCRFDVLAIESRPGSPPIVRLHKSAF